MSDEDLLVKVSDPQPSRPSALSRANWALIVSVVSVLFAGFSWWEARQNRLLNQRTQAPYIEILKEDFMLPSTLFMTVHNIGHAPALKLGAQNDAYIGGITDTGSSFAKVPSGVGMPGMSFLPNLPVGRETQIGAYVPSEVQLKMAGMKYDSQLQVMELRGAIRYADDDGTWYKTPFCYEIHLPYGPGVPVASRCVRLFDPAPDGVGFTK